MDLFLRTNTHPERARWFRRRRRATGLYNIGKTQMNLIFFLQIKIKKKWRNFLLFFLPCPFTMDEGGTGSRHTRLSLMAIIIHLIWPERYVLQLINVSIDYIDYYTSNSGGGTRYEHCGSDDFPPPAVAVWLRNPKKKGATARLLLLLLHQQTRPLDRYIYIILFWLFFSCWCWTFLLEQGQQPAGGSRSI